MHAAKKSKSKPGLPQAPACADFLHAIELDLAAEILHSFGELRMVAFGSSMLPSVRPGDLLTVDRIEPASARPGHVVLCARHDHFVAHRVVREETHDGRRILITQGDALAFEDPLPVAETELLGRVSCVTRGKKSFPPEPARGLFCSLLRLILRRSQHATTFLLRFNALRHRAERAFRSPALAKIFSRPFVAPLLRQTSSQPSAASPLPIFRRRANRAYGSGRAY